MERPRKLGAAVTNRTFAPDEFIYQNDGMDFDAKRDRWKDYDPEEYTEIIESASCWMLSAAPVFFPLRFE